MAEDAPAVAQPDVAPAPASQDAGTGLTLDWVARTINGQPFTPPAGWSPATNDRHAAGEAMISGGTWFDTADVAAHYGVPLGSVFDAQGRFVGVFPTAGMEGLPAGGEDLVYRLDPASLQWQGLRMPTGRFGLPDWGFGALMGGLMLAGGVGGGLATGGAGAGAAAAGTAGAEAGTEAGVAGAAGAGAAGAEAGGGVAGAVGAEAGTAGAEAGAAGSGGILGTGVTTSQVSQILRGLSLANSLANIGQNPSGGNVGSLLGSLAGSATGIPGGSTVGGLAGGAAGGAVDDTGGTTSPTSGSTAQPTAQPATTPGAQLNQEELMLLILLALGQQGSQR